MKEDKFLWIVYLLALFSSSFLTGIQATDVLIGTDNGTVTFNIEVSNVPDGHDLDFFYHPSGDVLFIITLQNGNLKMESPSQSVYKQRIDQLVKSPNKLSFRLRLLQKIDAGLYKCKTIKCEQMLVIADKPSKPVVDSITPILAYLEAELKCSTTSTSLPLNHLVMKYIWNHNNKIVSDSTNSTLIIDVSKSSEGDKFTCQSYELIFLKSDISQPEILHPDFGPEEIKILPTSTIQSSVTERVVASCNVECMPTCIIFWLRNSQNILSSNLVFNNITRLDNGIYSCHAKNKHGTSNKDLIIDVLYPPIIVSEKLADVTSYMNYNISENSDMNITIEIDSNPESHVLWFKNGNELKNNDITMVTEGPIIKSEIVKKQLYTSIYKIIKAQCADMGNYSSMMSNKFGTISSSTFSLHVLCSPRIDVDKYFKTEFAPEIGSSVDIVMRVIAYPLPVIKTIYHNGSVIHERVFTIKNQQTVQDYITVFHLTKSNIMRSELGLYEIELANSVDSSVNISVHFKQKGRPSTPIDLKATEVKALSVSLNWTSSFNGGFQQTFSVWYKHSHGNWTFYNQTYHDPGEGESVTAVITGLRDLTVYKFRISSKNVLGMSAFSPDTLVTTKELKTTIESAGLSADLGMWIGIALAAVVIIVVCVVIIIILRKKMLERKQAKFFRELKEAGSPMMQDQNNFNDLSNKENHIYEEISERSSSPSNNNTNYVQPYPPSKPPRTFEEPELRKPEPIWKPNDRKSSKVNENTEHLQMARMSLKPVVNKGQL